MKSRKYKKFFFIRLIFIVAILLLISCSNNMVLMNSKGQIGLEQRSLILTAIGLMLIVVIPVIVMAIFFSIRYRSSNEKQKYNPTWDHSKQLEIIFWTIPILIIIVLGVITWKSTYYLDPKEKLIRFINTNTNYQPIKISVIALDWKWLFIYPEQGIATINELAFPKNVPIQFIVTSNSVMNSFFIPQLGSQIYAMSGMNSQLNLIANESGFYKGISSNFSGRGFSGMKFTAIVTQDMDSFNEWIKKVKESPNKINTMNDYEKIAKPTEYHPVEYFSSVKSDLFQIVLRKYKYM